MHNAVAQAGSCPYQLLLSWRSGYVLHLHLGPSLDLLAEGKGGSSEALLAGICKLGHSPVISRSLPGEAS